jgi:phage shock protein A
MIFGKIFSGFKAILNTFANWFGLKRSPVAAFRLKVDEATERIKKGQANLAVFKGHVNRLERQFQEDDKQVKLAQVCVDIALKGGNDAAAQEADLTLQRAEATRTQTSGQLDSFNKQYQQQVSAIKNSRNQIVAAQSEAEQLGVRLEMSKANKDAAALASEFSDDIQNPLSDISAIRNEINNQIDGNNAVADVNVDLGIGVDKTASVEEQYQQMQVGDRLAARKAALGLAPKVEVSPAVHQLAAPVEVVQGVVVTDSDKVLSGASH